MKGQKLTIENLEEILSKNAQQSGEPVSFPVSNERYPKQVEEVVSSLSVDSYIGVCGGGTQNLKLLSLLQKTKNLSTATLIDVRPSQLHNFIELARFFNLGKENGYESTLMERAKKSMKISGYDSESIEILINLDSYKRTNLLYPELSTPISLRLCEEDIQDYFYDLSERNIWSVDPSEKKKYFIYLSNIYQFDWLGYGATQRMLDNLADNDAVEPGSIVFMSHHDDKMDEFSGYNSAVILQKRDPKKTLFKNHRKTVRFVYDKEIKVRGFRRLF